MSWVRVTSFGLLLRFCASVPSCPLCPQPDCDHRARRRPFRIGRRDVASLEVSCTILAGGLLEAAFSQPLEPQILSGLRDPPGPSLE